MAKSGIELIEQNMEAIRALAKEFVIARLEVFGSVCTPEFDPEKSDVDFLVEYPENYEMGPWLTRYFELEERLEALLGRKVDLVMTGALKNKYFIIEDTAAETFASYQQNRRLRQSVERSFITIGEAMRRLRDLDRSTFDRITKPAQIVAFRNLLIHEYGVIDDAEVWQTVQKSLPVLLSEVEELLREAGE